MTDINQKRDRDTWLMATTALATPLLIGGAVIFPKSDGVYSATDRLFLTAFVFAAATAGLITLASARRRFREARMLRRYGAASGAVRDTLTYLRNEERWAARGRLPALTGSLLCLALYILSRWPQLSALAPLRDLFGALSLGLLISVPLLAIRNRGHYVNSVFLRRYLKQQLDHLGYRPPKQRWRTESRRSKESIVAVTGPGSFTINGFAWTFEQLCTSAIVIGATGSGKTVTILNSLCFGLIASSSQSDAEKISGLVLDAKGDFFGKLKRVCALLGRAGDLFILDPTAWPAAAGTSESIAWNLLENNDPALEVATRLVAVLRMLGLELGNEGSFFTDSARIFLQHAIVVVRAAATNAPPSIIDVYRLSQEGEEQTPLYHSLIRAIAARHSDNLPTEIADAIAYFEREWGPMADRQKSGVQGSITQILGEFLVPPYRAIFGSRTTISIPELLDQGKLLYVHMPISESERMSRVVSTLIKLEFQRHVLLRTNKARPSFFLCDEFQTFYTTGEGRGDSDFFERSRESNHANIVASQNLTAFLKRNRNSADVKNFLGNCATKLFLRNTEEESNRFASGLFGTRSEVVVTTSEQAAVDGRFSRRHHTSYGRSTRALPRVPPEAFTRLAIPIKGDPAHQYAECIGHFASRGDTEHHTLIWPVNPLE